jgi:6-phosphogluconolactonase (cycloisomerase 2 family)
MCKKWYKVFLILLMSGIFGCGTHNDSSSSAASDTVDHTTLSTPADIVVDSKANEILIANKSGDSIVVFNRTANGDAYPKRVIKGSNTTIRWPNNLVINPVTEEIIVANDLSNQVLAFPLSSDNDVSPSWHQYLDVGMWEADVIGVDINVEKNVLVVFDSITGSLASYPLTGTGELNYYHRLTVSAFYDKGPITDIAIDKGNNNIYVLFERAIAVYPLDFTKTTEPLRTITSVDISSGRSIVIDNINDEIAITNHNGDNIVFFPLSAAGDMDAIRKISGAKTLLNIPCGIAIDPVNNEVFVTNINSNSITIYERTANGNVAPLRVIKGPDKS